MGRSNGQKERAFDTSCSSLSYHLRHAERSELRQEAERTESKHVATEPTVSTYFPELFSRFFLLIARS